MFARTWAEAREMVDVDRVIIVMGKVDTGRGDVQILAERVSQNFEVTLLEGPVQYSKSGWQQETPDWAYAPDSSDDMMISEDDALDSRELDDEDGDGQPAMRQAIIVSASSVEPPIDFPHNGDDSADGNEPPIARVSPQERSSAVPSANNGSNGSNGHHGNGNGHASSAFASVEEQEQAVEAIPEVDPDAPPRLLTITILISTDRDKERRRINRIYHKLLEFPGRDKFCFRLVTPDQRERLQSFEDESTHFEAVEDFLRKECGPDSIEVIDMD
jgi:hypothetical protein